MMNNKQDKPFGGANGRTFSELIEQLGKSAESSAQFLANLLAVQCFLGQADAGAILSGGGQGRVDVLAVYPQLEKGATAPAWLVQSAEFAQEVHAGGVVAVRPLKQTLVDDESGQRHLVLIPVGMADIEGAVAAFLIETDDEAVLVASSERLQIATAMSNYAGARPGQQIQQGGFKRLQQTMEILSAINREDKFAGAAMAFCNEVASQWQCERVSIGFLKQRYVQLKAMSHTEDFSKKMKVIQDIESAMEECLDQDIEILSPAPNDSTYISRSTDELSKRYGPLAVLSLPLRRGDEVAAVLILERPADKCFSLDEIETVRLTCELCTARLVNLYRSDRWIGASIADKTRNLMAGLLGPKHTWAKVVTILCFGAILFLIFAKGQFRPKAPFILEATYQQVIPAPFDGYIKNVEVEVSEMVEGGSSVLASLDTAEHRLQLAAAKSEKAGYLKQVAAAMRDSEIAQAQIAQANADKTQAQIDLLQYLISRASIISPISGIVVKGDLKRQIGAPVKTGDVLFEVCPLESLRAELMIPEEEIYYIKVDQEGSLATASYPGQRIKFVVERINPMAEVVNQRNVFKVRVRLLQRHPWMRPGMEGVARVSVGKRRYVWIWTRKIVNWIRMKLWL